MIIYIASRDENGGIMRCSLTEDGQLDVADITPVDRPAFLCSDGQLLYALLREPFQLMSGVCCYRMDQDGGLLPRGEIRSTHGLYSAHVYAGDGKIWIANYIDGTVALLGGDGSDALTEDRIIAFKGHGPDKNRQLSSHPHCVVPSPDKLYLCVTDLGTDRIYVLTPELEPVSSCSLPPGSGPRHLVFSPDGRFAFSSNELDSTVSSFRYHAGVLEYLGSVSSLPEEYREWNAASAIRISPEGNRLYVSNRGQNCVAVFDIHDSELSQSGYIPCFGNSPRDIALVGDYLLCGNELSDNVTVFSLKDGIPDSPVCNLPVKMPWCILPAEEKKYEASRA